MTDSDPELYKEKVGEHPYLNSFLEAVSVLIIIFEPMISISFTRYRRKTSLFSSMICLNIVVYIGPVANAI